MQPASPTVYHPKGNDATAVNPENYRKRGATNYASVVDVYIAPNTPDKQHTHNLRAVIFYDQAVRQKIVFVAENGSPAPIAPREITVIKPEGFDIQPSDTMPMHFTQNLADDQPLRATRIEIRGNSKLKTSQGYSPDLEPPMSITANATRRDLFSDVVLWDLPVHPGRNIHIETKNKAGLLIAHWQTVVKVWKRVSDKEFEFIKAYDKPENEQAERPHVWPLNKISVYDVLNDTNNVQRLYLLEIKV